MTCACGHNKSEHQYEQDTQSKTGLCEHSTQMIFKNAKKHCGCHQYKKILGDEEFIKKFKIGYEDEE